MATRSTDLGTRVRDARTSIGFTQEQLATTMGLSRDQVAAIELGRRDVSASELYPLARALSVRVLDLIGEDDLEVARTPQFRNLPAGTDVSELEAFAKTYLRREASLRRVVGAGE